MNILLTEERKKRIYFEDEAKILKMEKDNLDELYKNLLSKQKQMLRIDIDRTKN